MAMHVLALVPMNELRVFEGTPVIDVPLIMFDGRCQQMSHNKNNKGNLKMVLGQHVF
jgi:hypothetical protein